MGCNIAKQRRDTENPTLKLSADHKIEQIHPLSRASTIRNDDSGGKFDSENPSSNGFDSNKQIGSDTDNGDKNCSIVNIPKGNDPEVSFKGSSTDFPPADRDKDSIIPITRTNSETNRSNNIYAVVRPSPFLLEKRNSEKNFFLKKSLAQSDDLLEKTATFIDSSLTNSKIIQDSEVTNMRKIEPLPSSPEKKNLMVIPQEEMQSFNDSESKLYTKTNTLESVRGNSKGTENTHRTEVGTNQSDANEKLGVKQNISETEKDKEKDKSQEKSLGKNGFALPFHMMHKNLLEKKKSNEAVLVLPSDSLQKDHNTNNSSKEEKPQQNRDTKFRVNLLELVRKPDNEYSKKESNSTAEDDEHQSKRVLAPIEQKPVVVGQNGFPRKNLISFARSDTKGESRPESVTSLPATSSNINNLNGVGNNHIIDTFSPQIKPNNSALHINLVDFHSKQLFFEGMTPITPVDTSFTKSYLDRTVMLDVNNISRYDPEQISVNYDIQQVQYDEAQEQQRNAIKRNPNKKYSKSKSAFPEPDIKSYTSLAPENGEPASMNCLSPMANQSRNLLHSPNSPAVTPSSRFISSQRYGYHRTKSQVIETNQMTKSKDKEGQKKINNYTMIKEVGRGGFGKVKLAIKDTDNSQYVF